MLSIAPWKPKSQLTCDISGAENAVPEMCAHPHHTAYIGEVHLKFFLRNFQRFMFACFPLTLDPYGSRLHSSNCPINKRYGVN
jgi:hypothetical protein